MRTWMGALLVLAVGCTGTSGPITTEGDRLYSYFPFGGDLRRATYHSAGSGLAYFAVGEVQADPELMDDGTAVYETRFTKQCVGADKTCKTGDELWYWRISATHGGGVQLHDTNLGGKVLALEDFLLATPTMNEGDQIANPVGDATVTVTYEGTVDCPTNYWGSDRPECIHLSLDDAGAGTGLQGNIWATTQIGIVTFEFEATGEEDWALYDYEYED